MRPRPTTNPRLNGRSVNPVFIRRVWGAVTVAPGASIAELAADVGARSTGNVASALRVLANMGYITIEGCRARRILVPLWPALPRVGGKGLEVYR
jgi:hypothetical protein